MEKRFKKLYKKATESIISKGKAQMEKLIRKFEDATHYQKAMQILKEEVKE